MGSTPLWLPGSVDPPERLMVCRVVTGPGETCGRTFTRPDVWQRHVGRCARAHMDEIRAESLTARMPVFDIENWSPDAERHVLAVGERMKAEGRLDMKPHERVHNE
jgi:hypothetical protein